MGFKTKEEKENQVLDLLEDGMSYREIQKRVHVTPNFISNVVKKRFGENNLINNSDPKVSKNSKAIQLLCEGKSPITIAQELDIDADQIEKSYSDFIRLSNLGRFNHIIQNSNKPKLALLIKLVDFLHKNGIKTIESIQKIFLEIQTHEVLREEINRFSKMKLDLNFENSELQNQINEKNKLIETKNDWLRFIKSKNDELKSEISKKQKTILKLKKLFNNMNNLEAFQDLKNILTENIENAILVKDNKIILSLLSLCELYKDDSKLRNLMDDYSCEFKDTQLSIDNLEERVEYIKNSEFDNFISNWIKKLFDTYSLSVIDFALDRYFGSKNLYLKKQTVID